MGYSDYDTAQCAQCGRVGGGSTGDNLASWADLNRNRPTCPDCAYAIPQWTVTVETTTRTTTGDKTRIIRTEDEFTGLTYREAVLKFERLITVENGAGDIPTGIVRHRTYYGTHINGRNFDVEVTRGAYGPHGATTTWNGPRSI